MRSRITRAAFALIPLAAAGALSAAIVDGIDDDALSAGIFTINRFDADSFAEPAPVLTYKQQQKFLRGRHHFNQNWVQFPSLGGDWGLGPTFITDRCSTCHVKAGRGSPPERADQQAMSLLVRLSVPGTNEHGGPKPHPVYGDQIQNQGLMGQDRDGTFLGERVYPEADVFIDWEESTVTVTFDDGEKVALRQPKLRWGKMWFGPVGPETMTSLRMAQPIQGLGLLEAVPEATILALADQQKALGFNGRPNRVRDDINNTMALGRFGWKANQPSVKQQIAAAYAGDLGVTSSLYLDQNCPGPQTDCAAQPPGNQPELIDSDWDELTFWELALAVPARRNVNDPQFKQGERLFTEAQCAVCHVPRLTTADTFPALPQLAKQTFRAYTDLLLHDMGDGLADGRPDFQATGRDWRTQPLWGIGLSETVSGSNHFLHDGRARSITEAILWHGGEAEGAKEKFRKMRKAERQAMLRFLGGI